MMPPSITLTLRQLENPLAMRIVTGECPEGSRVHAELGDGQIQFRIDRPSRASWTRPPRTKVKVRASRAGRRALSGRQAPLRSQTGGVL
jgi:hypothetical protein